MQQTRIQICAILGAEPMRKSTLEFVAGNEEEYMLDSVTEHTEKRFISSGEKTLNSTARMNSRGGKDADM